MNLQDESLLPTRILNRSYVSPNEVDVEQVKAFLQDLHQIVDQREVADWSAAQGNGSGIQSWFAASEACLVDRVTPRRSVEASCPGLARTAKRAMAHGGLKCFKPEARNAGRLSSQV